MAKKTYYLEVVGAGKTTCYRNDFKRLCEELKLPYHTLKKMPFPREWRGWKITRKELI